MRVVAVANPFSRSLLKQQDILSQDAIVYDVSQLDSIVKQQCLRMHVGDVPHSSQLSD